MALGVIRTDSAFARTAIAAGVLACLFLAVFFAKWCFANNVSMRAATIDVADLAVQLGPDDPQTHYAAAVLYDRTFEPQDIARSLAEYEKAALLSPNNYLSWLELGKARGRNGDVPGSERAFLRALELAPNYADVRWAYGNFLLRAGRMEEGFSQIRTAAAARPEYMSSAAITAMTLLDGDASAVRNMLGNTGLVNSALATYALSGDLYAEAAAAWDQISADEKRTTFSETGKVLSSRLAGAKYFRMAARVAAESWETGEPGPGVGNVLNGDFETAVKLKAARLFDWQVANGPEPQIGMSDTQKHSGSFSLYMIFNATQASDIRSVAQTVAVEPGKSYSFQGFYRSELKGSLAWEVVDANDGKNLARTGPVQSSADWAIFQATFTVPEGSDGITIRLVRDGCTSSVCPIAGKVWFDDLLLQTQGSSTIRQ
jgi:tetratricopeptide (TPR) repeat protein